MWKFKFLTFVLIRDDISSAISRTIHIVGLCQYFKDILSFGCHDMKRSACGYYFLESSPPLSEAEEYGENYFPVRDIGQNDLRAHLAHLQNYTRKLWVATLFIFGDSSV
ncbi:hypothetical protein L6164_030692 [Bauhinia variegata]|uniref:Uncharacterized protein n=1 Tax=Bauhinia variegata TaxID=167791 RepID=A0ACB9LEF5_BAUVA|nr:hypothetical protein L6164_030692 [Bauhinia variegata]